MFAREWHSSGPRNADCFVILLVAARLASPSTPFPALLLSHPHSLMDDLLHRVSGNQLISLNLTKVGRKKSRPKHPHDATHQSNESQAVAVDHTGARVAFNPEQMASAGSSTATAAAAAAAAASAAAASASSDSAASNI